MHSYDEEGGEQNDQTVPNNFALNFQEDFIRGCMSFLTVAVMVRGEGKNAQDVFQEFVNPIVGNRNHNKTAFSEIMPVLYQKVIEYCTDAIAVSEMTELQQNKQKIR